MQKARNVSTLKLKIFCLSIILPKVWHRQWNLQVRVHSGHRHGPSRTTPASMVLFSIQKQQKLKLELNKHEILNTSVAECQCDSWFFVC